MLHLPRRSLVSAALAASASSVLCTLSTFTRSPAPSGRAGPVAATFYGDDFQATVRAEDSSVYEPLHSASVRAVVELMNATIPRVTGGPQGLALTRAVLTTAYPGLVNEESAVPYYTWVWCEEMGTMIPICCASSQFLIALPTPVRVGVEVVANLD